MITNIEAASLLASLDLGSGVAETDGLLEAARIETSVFDDLLADRIDLIPGTKGSGKTALYRIFVDFLPDLLLQDRRVVIAHGVQQRQDTVFLAFKEQFEKLNEGDFIDFWCIYLVSLANEQFIRASRYADLISSCDEEVSEFRRAYRRANIPEFDRSKTLKEIIAWSLEVVRRLKPKLTWKPPEDVGQFELSFGQEASKASEDRDDPQMPAHVDALVTSLEALLGKADFYLWLMVDRLDELFARRSNTERKALRGLLQALRLFRSGRIRVKVFLRDDMLEQIVQGEGFTALSHVAARRADTLRWSEEQILAMVVRRIFANEPFRDHFGVNGEVLLTSVEYQKQLFYKIFDDTVYRPPNQSPTLRWIYNHTKDGRGVVTPRDVIALMTRAGQSQRDTFKRDPAGQTNRLIYGPAIVYGLGELSKEKRTLYLEAEFPHKWGDIRKLVGGGTQYGEQALRRIFGRKSHEIADDFVSIGVFERATRKGELAFNIPFVYRAGLECTQRFVNQ